MKLICLQAGHQNTPTNCVPAYRSGTGAPDEVGFTIRIRDRLSQILQLKGFQIQLVDANFNCDPNADKHFDLFLAIHYDANVYGTGGGFVDFPEPSTDQATAESQRIVKAIVDEYFKNTGIVNVPSRSNGNTRYYYMWQYLSADTPCAIIECGVGKDAHDNVILNDTDRVCNAIARGICKAFNVPFDAVTPTPTPPPVVTPPANEIAVLKQKIEDMKQTEIRLKNEMVVFQTETTKRLADKDKECEQKIKDFKTKTINFVTGLN